MNKGKRIKKIRRIVTLAFIACVMSTCSVFSLGTSASIVAPKSVTKQVNAQLNIAPEVSYSKGFKLKWNRVKRLLAMVLTMLIKKTQSQVMAVGIIL